MLSGRAVDSCQAFLLLNSENEQLRHLDETAGHVRQSPTWQNDVE